MNTVLLLGVDFIKFADFIGKFKDNFIFCCEFIGVAVAMVVISVIAQKIIMKKNGEKGKILTTRVVAGIGIFGAISATLMIFEVPLFIIPSEYKFEFGDLAALIGGFAFGPVAAVLIEVLKITIKLIFKSTSTAFVGEFANFCVGCAFVLPASIIYHIKKTRKTALVSCITGTLSMVVIGYLLNLFFVVPTFISMFFGGDSSVIISGGNAVNPLIKDVNTYVLFAAIPINLLKGGVDSIIAMLIYKPLSPYIKGNGPTGRKAKS